MTKDNALSYKQDKKCVFNIRKAIQFKLTQYSSFFQNNIGAYQRYCCIVTLRGYQKIMVRTELIAFIYSLLHKAEILVCVSN